MEELFNLAGKYNLNLSFNEDEREIYASSNTANSVLVEDLQKIKETTGAEKAELHADAEYTDAEYNFLISLTLPEEQ